MRRRREGGRMAGGLAAGGPCFPSRNLVFFWVFVFSCIHFVVWAQTDLLRNIFCLQRPVGQLAHKYSPDAPSHTKPAYLSHNQSLGQPQPEFFTLVWVDHFSLAEFLDLCHFLGKPYQSLYTHLPLVGPGNTRFHLPPDTGPFERTGTPPK